MERHSLIKNYVIAGLESYLVGEPEKRQRILSMTRDQVDFITPHSHRFDLVTQVLKGKVTNILFELSPYDLYAESILKYEGKPGNYTKRFYGYKGYKQNKYEYKEGDFYSMPHWAIHSIVFEKGTEILITESKQITNESVILEPFSGGKHVNNFNIPNNLFIKG
jgi:quercetin dioxygenase-like cupin family protein